MKNVDLAQEAERISGRNLEKRCEVMDKMMGKLLGPVARASWLAKMKLMDIGFDELVKKYRKRKRRNRHMRKKLETKARRTLAKLNEKKSRINN